MKHSPYRRPSKAPLTPWTRARDILRDTRGFSMTELIVVLAAIGVLAGATLVATSYLPSKGHKRNMEGDLHRLVTDQVDHRDTFFTFASAIVAIDQAATAANLPFQPSPGVVITLSGVDANNYTATATHPNVPNEQCQVAVTSARAGTSQIRCTAVAAAGT